jgi:hypothetical protein
MKRAHFLLDLVGAGLCAWYAITAKTIWIAAAEVVLFSLFLVWLLRDVIE